MQLKQNDGVQKIDTKQIISFLQNRNNVTDEYEGLHNYFDKQIYYTQKNQLSYYQQYHQPTCNVSKSQEIICKHQILTIEATKHTRNSQAHSIQFMNNGFQLLTGTHQITSQQDQKKNVDLHLINLKTLNKDRYFPDKQGEINGIGGLCLMNNGKNILLGDKSGQIYVLDYLAPNPNNLRNKKTHQPMNVAERISPEVDSIQEICCSPDDNKLAFGDGDKVGTIHVYDYETKKKEQSFIEGYSKINQLQWHPSQAIIMSGNENKYINLWCPKQKESLLKIYQSSGVNKSLWHKNGNWILSCGQDKTIKLYDIRNPQEFKEYKCKSEVKSLCWHPNDPYVFASGEINGKILQWNINSEVCIDQTKSDKIEENERNDKVEISDIKYNPQGTLLAAFGRDKKLQVFSTQQKE